MPGRSIRIITIIVVTIVILIGTVLFYVMILNSPTEDEEAQRIILNPSELPDSGWSENVVSLDLRYPNQTSGCEKLFNNDSISVDISIAVFNSKESSMKIFDAISSYAKNLTGYEKIALGDAGYVWNDPFFPNGPQVGVSFLVENAIATIVTMPRNFDVDWQVESTNDIALLQFDKIVELI